METESPLDHLPREPEEISREWLFAVINQYRRARDLSLLRHPDDILDCSIDECQSSHGYLSTTYKLLAHFQCENLLGSEDCSYAFFLKMLPGVGEKYQKLVLSTQVFRREIEAQFHLLPLLKQFVDHQNLKASFVPSPEIVYGSYDEAEGDGIIVLMDLNERGFHPLNHYFGLNLGQLEKVVEQLAEFHASGSAMLLQEENAATKFKMFHSDNQNNRQNIYESLYPHYRDFAKFLRRVPGYYHCFHKVDQLRPNLVPIMTKSETRKSRFPLKTIVHGELWDKNILMRFEQLTQSLEVVFTDWKDLSIGSPCQDLAFLMLACTSKNLRVKHKNQILRKYFQTYCNVLRKFNIKLSTYDVGFTVQEFIQEYEEATFGAFLQVVTLLIREVKYLEAEFINAEDEAEKETFGEGLRILGRRLLEVSDEFIPQLGSKSPPSSVTSSKKGRKANGVIFTQTQSLAEVKGHRNGEERQKH